MLTSARRMKPVTITSCLPLVFLLSQCEGLPSSRDNVLSSPDTLLYVALTAEATSIHASWAVQPPANPAGEYKVTWVDQHDRLSNIFVTDKTETLIDGLKPCTQYTVSVTRVYKTGQLTTDSVEKSTTTQNEAPPSVTGLLSRDITARNHYMSWERPATECEITAYRITYEGFAKWAPYVQHKNMRSILRGVADNTTEFKVADLQPYSDYTVMVVAYTREGRGRSTNLTITTKQDVPQMPLDLLTGKPTATSITATWDEPAVANGVLGPYYVSWHRDGERIGSERESLTTYTIAGLSPCVEYTIHVAASTEAGTGDYKEIRQTTQAAAPPATTDIICHSNEDRSVTMTWTKADTACPITGYKVSRPKNYFDNDDIDTVDVTPSVLSANFSTQTGTNFRACVTAVVAESLIGSQACCNQETLRVQTSAPREHLYYKIATFILIGLVSVLVALLLFFWIKGKHTQHETDELNVNQGVGENPPADIRIRTPRHSRNLQEIKTEDWKDRQDTNQLQSCTLSDDSPDNSSSDQLPHHGASSEDGQLPMLPGSEPSPEGKDMSSQNPLDREQTYQEKDHKQGFIRDLFLGLGHLLRIYLQ